ncbi:MAG TPA: serine hydrolase [Xanthomonadales bacterium]|nr:serine hydrolase [Xanthomonadales bacterium]
MTNTKYLLVLLMLLLAGPLAAQEPETTEIDVIPLADPELVADVVVEPEPDLSPSLQKEDLDAWLDGFMPYALETADIPGAVVVVVKNGQILSEHGYGVSDVETGAPVDPGHTLFRPGSVSKLVTWTAVMQLKEAGKVDLDADINQYLDFKVPDEGNPITLRNLLTHTGGFEEAIKNLLFHDPARLQSLGDYLKAWVPEQIFEPGTTPAYSNYGTALAGYIVERVSGQPFDDYVDEHIFAPLDMQDSTFRQPLPEDLADQMSRGYLTDSKTLIEFELLGPAPAGSMTSTGADMAKFMIAHLQHGRYGDNRILQEETAREMHETALTLLPPLNRMELGFFETNINDEQVIAHLGDTRAFHTAMHLFVDRNVGLYLSVNGTGKQGAAGKVRSALFEQFADRYFPATDTAAAEPAAGIEPGHAEKLAGVWWSSRGARSNFFGATGMLGGMKVSVNGKGELVIPSQRGLNGQTTQWVEVEPYVWHEVGGHNRLAAVVENGEVVRWSVDGLAPFTVFERVPASMSSAWLAPAMQASVAIFALTFLFWPLAAMVRRYYGVKFKLQGVQRSSYRRVRVFAGLVLAVLGGWLAVFTVMTKDFSNMSDVLAPWLWLLYIGGVIAFVGSLLVNTWNVRVVWQDRGRWFAKLWSLLLVLAAATVLWGCYAYKLLAFTVDF